MGVWFREPMIVGKSGTIFWEISDDTLVLIRFSRQSRQWWQLVFQFWHRNHWLPRSDWYWLCRQIYWLYIPDWWLWLPDWVALHPGIIPTKFAWHDCRHWRQFGDKKDRTGWRIQILQWVWLGWNWRNWLETDKSWKPEPPAKTFPDRFIQIFQPLQKTKKDDPSPEEPESSLFSVSKPSSSIS